MNKFLKVIVVASLCLSLLSGSFSLGFNHARAAVPTLETNPAVLGPLGVTSSATTGNLVKRIMEFVFKLSTEKLKRSLLDTLTSQMVTAVAGGEPKFVTNWEDYLRQNYSTGLNQGVLNLQNSGFLGSDRTDALIISRLTGQPVSIPSESAAERYRRSQPFSYGSYLNSWLPENNYYGKSIIAEDYARQQAAAAAEAAKNEALAGGGFLPTKDSNGNITTPGKTVGDVLSRAVTSDIDYLVNVQDLEGFIGSISNSVFNKLLSAGGSGISGVANEILTGGGIGSFSLDSLTSGSVGSVGSIDFNRQENNRSNSLGGFTFNATSTSQLSSGYTNTVPRNINDPNFQNEISQELQAITSAGLETSLGDLGLGSANFTFGTVRENKISAYADLQKAAWFLDDLKKSLTLKANITAGRAEGSVFSSVKYCADDDYGPNSKYFYVLPNIGNDENDRLAKAAEVDLLLKRVETLLREVESNITNPSEAETAEDVTLAAVQRELLRNLFQAGLSISNSRSNNFDVSSRLPLTMVPVNDNRKVQETESIYFYCPTYQSFRTVLTSWTSPAASVLQFFRNNIQFRYSNTTSGNGNYLGLSISSDANQNEFFYLNEDRISNYLNALSSRLDAENYYRQTANLLDRTALNRRIAYRQSKEQVVFELDRAIRYLEDVDSGSSLLSQLRSNFNSELNNLTRVEITEDEVQIARSQAVALSDLFLAGLGQRGTGQDFDITNDLPVNVTEHSSGDSEIPVAIVSGNVKTSLTPYSGNQNFLGFSVNTVFYRHSNNQSAYLSALENKIKQLKTDGFLN